MMSRSRRDVMFTGKNNKFYFRQMLIVTRQPMYYKYK